MTPAGLGGRVRGLLFDLDGTLIDTVALILSSFRYATTEVLGAPLSDEVLMRGVGIPLATQMREFAPDHADELLRVYREHNASIHDDMVAEYPGTRETLQMLAGAGFPMGVVTSKGAPMAHRGLDAFALREFFEVVVTSDDVERHKPDPYPLDYAAGLMGLPTAEMLYLGDSPHDMTAAIAAGAISVAALWGAFPSAAVLHPGPEYALNSITELPLLLNGDSERLRVQPACAGASSDRVHPHRSGIM
ncbi:MAG: HAD-IA family hydrolase [Coriobacteriia bacterium]|jgi:pyrophosphatase PpaX|nr:HAD-IA family hydrolase [Coriobacteriia bacterium]